jgi:hypothetical protein
MSRRLIPLLAESLIPILGRIHFLETLTPRKVILPKIVAGIIGFLIHDFLTNPLRLYLHFEKTLLLRLTLGIKSKLLTIIELVLSHDVFSGR